MTTNENPINNQPSGPSQHVGDVIDVGDLDGVSAVAIGRGARITLEQYTEIIIKADNFEDQPPAPGEPPYKGLAYFTEADKDNYFGRETLSDHLVERLQGNSFLALIGASGSGKSSLLRAGVIPRLRAANWRIHLVSKPGANPLQMLANNLTQEELDPGSAAAIAVALAANPATLVSAGEKLAARDGAERLLLAMDQFEELFTQCKEDAERQALVDNLVQAAEVQGATAVLISMRADFYDRVSEFALLTDLVSQQQEYVKPMAQEDLVRVIAEPARLGGWQFVEGLVEQIVEDVGREPGRLPLLSHALLETWERRRGVVMTLGGYRDAGGVEGAIAQTAEETLHRLVAQNPAYENVSRTIFLALTELGEGTEDTRRVASREELRTAVDGEELDAVLEALVTARLITVRSGEVEVAHEALIRRWPALREWLADNRERLRFERQLEHDARLWQELGREGGALYRGARLSQAVELQESGYVTLAGLPAEFVAAGRELEEREEREREAQRQHELQNAQQLALAAQAREAAEIEARNAAEAQRASEEDARQQAEADAGNLRRRAVYLMAALAIAALLAIAAIIFFQNAQSNAREAEDNLAQATVALVAEATAVREAQVNLARANDNAATATRNLATAEAAKATSDYNEQQADYQAATAVAAQAMAVVAQGTAEAESTRALIQSEKALAQSLIANSRALASSERTNRVLAVARLLAVEGANLNALVGSNTEQTSSESWLFSLAYKQPIQYQAASTLTNDSVWAAAGLPADVWSIAWNKDGSRLASASYDRTIRIWDTASWQELATLSNHTDRVHSVAWNEDGSRLASASTDGTVIIWDTTSWQPITTLTNHSDEVFSVAWLEDGSRLASASCHERNSEKSQCIQGEIIIWDTVRWQPLTTLFDHTDAVLSVDWIKDGSRLASAACGERDTEDQCNQEEIIIWDSANWQSLTVLTGHTSPAYSFSVAWNEDGSRLASTSGANKFVIWETASWQPIATLTGHTTAVHDLAWNKDGNRLASASGDDTVIIWDTATWQPIVTLTGHTIDVSSVAWDEDGGHLASASGDGTIIIWDVASWNPQTTLTSHTNDVLGIDWNDDDSRLASSSCTKMDDDNRRCVEGEVIIWDAANWQPLTTLAGHTDSVNSLAWDADSSRLASTSSDDTILIWDTKSWQPLTTLTGHTNDVFSVAWNNDGSRLASASSDGTILIWDTVSWQSLTTLSDHSGFVWDVAWNKDGSQLASASCNELNNEDECSTGGVIIWDTTNWQPLTTLTDHIGWVWSVAWNEDSSRLASASIDGTIIIYDTASWQHLTTLSHQTDQVLSVAWNEDGSRLASASYGGTVIIWDTKSWQPLTTFSDHTDFVWSVAWNKDGSRLASASGDDTIIIWEFPDFERLLCEMAGRNLSLAEWEQYLPGADYSCTCAEWPAGEGAPPNAPGCAKSDDEISYNS